MPPVPMAPRQWVDRLHKQLGARQADVDLWCRYVNGDHDDPPVESTASVAFRRLLDLSKTNLTGLIVAATAARMEVQGFRFGDDPAADRDAWEIWQASNFDMESDLLIHDALKSGRGFLLVEPPTADDFPRLYAESARQVIVAYASGNRRERLAALKVWQDEWTGEVHANLFLPDRVFKLRTDAKPAGSSLYTPRWEPRDDREESVSNPLGVVPVFEITNRPGLVVGEARSEIADVLSDQDRANQIALNMLIAMEYGAFPQKWATGLELPRDPTTGAAVDTFEASIKRMWVTPSIDARFGAITPTDIKPYIDLYEATVKHMASVSETPASYLLGHLVNLSAEALAAAEAALVHKVRRKARHFEQPFEDAMRLCFASIGDPRGKTTAAETIWADPEIKSAGQVADAALKLVGGPVITAQTAQEMFLGMSATQRERDAAWRQEADALGNFNRLLDEQAAAFEAEEAAEEPAEQAPPSGP